MNYSKSFCFGIPLTNFHVVAFLHYLNFYIVNVDAVIGVEQYLQVSSYVHV